MQPRQTAKKRSDIKECNAKKNLGSPTLAVALTLSGHKGTDQIWKI